jgi:hypothetical protein
MHLSQRSQRHKETLLLSEISVRSVRDYRFFYLCSADSVRLSRWFFDDVGILEHLLRPDP